MQGGYSVFYARNTIPSTPKAVNDVHPYINVVAPFLGLQEVAMTSLRLLTAFKTFR
ncbi:hypothetical protein NC651_001993 [Populus alba x Populus x berolinensis]|nr:hypothetical protein NC651_001993 [Populus alba x Populus x berolinensis]